MLAAFELSYIDWGIAFLAMSLLGFSKAGLKGIAPVIVALMAIVFGSKPSTGIVVPLLVLGDIFAVCYYRRHVQWQYIWRLLPWMFVGMVLGTWIGDALPELLFKRLMGAVILFSVATIFLGERFKAGCFPKHWFFTAILGLGAGITTMVANLAGSFLNLFFLASGLPKEQFIGTVAWIYFLTNILKFFAHLFIWKTITLSSLSLDACLLPAVVVGLFLGLRFVKYISQTSFRRMVLLLTALGGLLVLWSN